MEAPTPLIEIRNLCLSFPIAWRSTSSVKDSWVGFSGLFAKKYRHPVLNQINLNVHHGDRIALIGTNGSGKSTLCRCISGQLRPDQGSLKKNGSLTAVIQVESGFFNELTGRENAELLSLFLFPEYNKAERADIVADSLGFSELGKFADSPMSSYSMGMRSRLALSLISSRPREILILDEVYNHADEFFQNKIQRRINAAISASGAVIVVSHYEKDLQLCNRGLVLQNGQIKFDGKIETALSAYRFLNAKNDPQVDASSESLAEKN